VRTARTARRLVRGSESLDSNEMDPIHLLYCRINLLAHESLTWEAVPLHGGTYDRADAYILLGNCTRPFHDMMSRLPLRDTEHRDWIASLDASVEYRVGHANRSAEEAARIALAAYGHTKAEWIQWRVEEMASIRRELDQLSSHR